MQIGEFAVGTAIAYVAVGAAWAATAAVWAPLLVAAAVVASRRHRAGGGSLATVHDLTC